MKKRRLLPNAPSSLELEGYSWLIYLLVRWLHELMEFCLQRVLIFEHPRRKSCSFGSRSCASLVGLFSDPLKWVLENAGKDQKQGLRVEDLDRWVEPEQVHTNRVRSHFCSSLFRFKKIYVGQESSQIVQELKMKRKRDWRQGEIEEVGVSFWAKSGGGRVWAAEVWSICCVGEEGRLRREGETEEERPKMREPSGKLWSFSYLYIPKFPFLFFSFFNHFSPALIKKSIWLLGLAFEKKFY